ncbi:MAG: hypothetical protein JXR91_08880, partial [Deltaproteobacteria bacterium]|nr:hypothetical protein [Deltaproteobacteria bacterium]
MRFISFRLIIGVFFIGVVQGCTSGSSDAGNDLNNNTDSASDSDSNVIITYDSDSNIISGTDSGSIITLQPLRIEAECGFGADKGDCDGKVDGTNSNLPGQDGADSIP